MNTGNFEKNQILEALSEVKGLFNRAWRQDQWDWFTVWSMLGRPGRKHCQFVSQQLIALRNAIKLDDGEAFEQALRGLSSLNVHTNLTSFFEGGMSGFEGGQVDILSTRETPVLLKIGYTKRSIETRLAEINRGTGIAIPFGVRAVWVVQDSKEVEYQIHKLLTNYRIRQDREFFRIEFKQAYNIIDDYVISCGIES